jgi:predicted transposase/invertase (TIGR01784 family)
MLRHALALLFPSGAESVQSLSRLGGGLLSKSSKIIQRPFLLQKAAARLSSTRIPPIRKPSVLEMRHKMTAAPFSPKIYGIATFDALFKHILSDDTIRVSFLNAFVPDVNVKSSTRLDEHMNPIQQLQLVRDFVHRRDTVRTITRLKSWAKVLKLSVMKQSKSSFVKDNGATIFFQEMCHHFRDIQKSFPTAKYDGTVDFACKLDNGDYVVIEMQAIPQNCWDMRALVYVASFYGNQLRKGGDWEDTRKVIGINILGGDKSDQGHWTDTPNQYVRRYRFQEQLHKDQDRSQRYIGGMEIVQYSLSNAPDNDLLDSVKQDWITFLKRGHHMNEQDVATSITTPEVVLAFERARLDKLPGEVRERYVEKDLEFDRYSDHTSKLLREGASEMARKMLVRGMPLEEIVEDFGLTKAEVEVMKTAASHEYRRKP